MKKKKVAAVLTLSILFIALMTGAFAVVFWQWLKPEEAKEVEAKEPKDAKMFSAYTEIEEFKDVPAIATAQGKIYDAKDYGNKNYLINVDGTTVEEYDAYLATLEQAGFKKHSDNGEDAMEGYVKTASYTKDNLTLTVAHAIRLEHTYISATYDLPLSDHLIYKDEYVQGIDPNAKTKLHMMQLNGLGNCFIIQLKNGHFVIEDGGTNYDAPYLLDYLESLVPEGEKPVIEAWIISHAHGDHMGAVRKISETPSDIRRIYVEGFYYTEPSQEVLDLLTMQPGTENNWYVTRIPRLFKSTTGDAPELYRMQIGQRYYFCDMNIDVSLTVEQYQTEAYYSNDFNDASTWLMHHIDGQKFLCAGDSNHTGMNMAMSIFDKSYLDLDVFAVLHHGINVYEYFIDYCTYKTVLYTSWREASVWEPSRADLARVEDNEYLREHCAEYYSHGNGTVVLTFPYTVGTAKIMPPFEWKYNGGLKRDTFK